MRRIESLNPETEFTRAGAFMAAFAVFAVAVAEIAANQQNIPLEKTGVLAISSALMGAGSGLPAYLAATEIPNALRATRRTLLGS